MEPNGATWNQMEQHGPVWSQTHTKREPKVANMEPSAPKGDQTNIFLSEKVGSGTPPGRRRRNEKYIFERIYVEIRGALWASKAVKSDGKSITDIYT